MWITICFDTAGELIKPSYIVRYDSFQIEIQRGGPSEGHNLYIEVSDDKDNMAHKAAYEAGRRLLSELAWLFDERVEVLTSGGGGHKTPVNVAGKTFNRIQNDLNLDDYEQIAFNYDQHLALGIYREGISSNSNFYKFLSFVRVLNIKCHTRTDHKNWINSNIHKLRWSKNLVHELNSEGITDLGEHLSS